MKLELMVSLGVRALNDSSMAYWFSAFKAFKSLCLLSVVLGKI